MIYRNVLEAGVGFQPKRENSKTPRYCDWPLSSKSTRTREGKVHRSPHRPYYVTFVGSFIYVCDIHFMDEITTCAAWINIDTTENVPASRKSMWSDLRGPGWEAPFPHQGCRCSLGLLCPHQRRVCYQGHVSCPHVSFSS